MHRIKNVNIKIEKIASNRIKPYDKNSDVYKIINKNIKPESEIIDIYNEDPAFLKNIHPLVYKDSSIISFFPETHSAVKVRKAINKKNIVIVNSAFENNDLKANSADIIIIADALSEIESKDFFKEINRVLKHDGILIFKEFLTLEKLLKISNSALVKGRENLFFFVINYYSSKIKCIKNIEFNLEINGFSDMIYLNKGGINKLFDFAFFFQEKIKKNNFTIKDLSFTLSGKRGLKPGATLII